MADDTQRERRSLGAAVGSISFATFLSRILGVVREQVLAYFFGAGVVSDAYNAAFRIPNLLRDLFAEGAMSSAFVPTFARHIERDGLSAAWRLGRRVMTALGVVLGVVTIAIFVFAPEILGLYVGEFDDDKMALTVTMTRILSPFLLFVALAAVAMGMLNSRGRFFGPALAPASFNVCAIVGMIALVPWFTRIGIHPGYSIAIGAVVGGLMQFAVQVPLLHREGFRPGIDFAPRDPGLRRIASLMVPATFGLAATQLSIFVDTHLAAGQGDGAISWLIWGFRLIQLPLGLFGVAIATANLARVSADAARGDAEGLRRNLAGAIRTAAVLTLPATAGLIALREPIVRVLFEHGEFDAFDTRQTAAAVLCYAFGLYAYSVTKIQAPTFYALGDTRRPVIASAVAVGAKIVAALVLLRVLPQYGVSGFLALAISTSVAAWVNFTQLAVSLRRRVGAFRGLRVIDTTLRMVVVAAVQGWGVHLVHGALERGLPGGGILGEIARLATAIAAGIALTLGVAFAVRVHEVRDVLERLRRRFAGGAR